MKLISLVTGGDDAFGCDYALVNLTSNLAQLACRRVAMLKEQKHMDASLVESYFWDAHAEFFSPWLAEQETEADVLAEALERLPAVGGDWMEAPAEFLIPDSQCDYTHNLTAFGPISWPRALRKPLVFNGPVWEYLTSWTHKMAASADWKDILATSPGIRRGQRQPQTGSPGTQWTYITAVAPLAGHFGKSPDYL